MNAIHFYRRYDAEGRCKVICMQCFQTLGTGWDRQSVEALEAAHVCAFWMEGAPSSAVRGRARSVPGEALLRDTLGLHAGLLILLTVLVLYLLPTVLEFAASYAWNPWLAVILPGDLIGCAVLVGLLRMPRTGAVLYLALTAIEGLSYAAHAVVVPELRWFADLVPTLLVITLVLRLKLRGRNLSFS